MAPAKWSTLDGVGFSKKHDEPSHTQPATLRGTPWSGLRRRRIVLSLIALLAIYLFIKNIPTTVAPVGQRQSALYGTMAPGHVLAHQGLLQNGGSGKQDVSGQQYEGSLQFPKLSSSLRPHLSKTTNNNVLFALPGLQSAKSLLPFACQMAQNNRSNVHMAILGRQDVKIQDILKVNGIAAEDCPVFWHDARPDHPLESSFNRLAASIQTGLGHCCAALHPQLILVEEAAAKDLVLDGLLRGVATGTGTPMTTLPDDVLQSLPWLSTLDASSLGSLKDVDIEIVIQARDNAAGTLLRLLHSIRDANYDGLFYPHLTIELPAHIDPFLSRFLETFRWPPGSSLTESTLTLRHRISSAKMKPEEASLHTLESFYPRTTNSHVLLLAPDAELSPTYLHYLMFALLEYKYGQDHQDTIGNIFGISLDLPIYTLDEQPLYLNKELSDREVLMMWQAPNNDAALIMGDKWIDLRNFLAHRLASDPELKIRSQNAHLVSKDHPSWLQEILELMQARGQYMLYPEFVSGKDSSRLVTLHQELHQTPEEYVKAMEYEKETFELSIEEIMHKDVLTDIVKHPSSKEPKSPVISSSAFQTLISPNGQGSLQRLPPLRDMPMFSYLGKATDWQRSKSSSEKFADEFSQHQGGCASLSSRDKTKEGSIDYLFCNNG